MTRFFSLDLADTLLICICYVERPSHARMQYAVRRLSKKNPGGNIILALLGPEIDAPSASMGPDVVEGPFSVALKRVGEAVSTVYEDATTSNDHITPHTNV